MSTKEKTRVQPGLTDAIAELEKTSLMIALDPVGLQAGFEIRCSSKPTLALVAFALWPPCQVEVCIKCSGCSQTVRVMVTVL